MCGAGTPAREMPMNRITVADTKYPHSREKEKSSPFCQFADPPACLPCLYAQHPLSSLRISPPPAPLSKDDRPVFVTFRRIRGFYLSPAARGLVLQHCLFESGRRIQLHAAVAMPDHVHLLFTALRDGGGWTFALPEIMKAIKGTSARSINKLMERHGPVWQDESFDHVIRGNESLKETVEYIQQNPVRRGLVAAPEDYEWLWIADDFR